MNGVHWICLGAALITNVFAANDWPQWRGPKRDGISPEKGLLQDWPAGGPKLAWKTTGLGNGYASVVTSGDKIFTMGDQGEDSELIALNRADGKRLWGTKVGKGGSTGWGGFQGPRSTPSTDGELVIGVGMLGELVCVDAQSGKEKWRKEYTSGFGGMKPEWGYSESPLIDGDKVIITPGGSQGAIVALNKKTGAVMWQAKEFKDPAHYSSIIGAEFGGVHQYVQLTEQNIAGVNAEDGRLLWKAMRKGSTAVIPTPVIWENYVYVTSGYNAGCNLFEIKGSSGKFTAQQIYASKLMQNHHGGVVRLGEYVYGHSDGKGWVCQKLKTGDAAWQERKFGKGSVVYADNRLYLRAEEGKGTVALIEASPTGYKEHGRFDQPDRQDEHTWAHPVVSDGKLYLRDADILLCYDIKAK